MSYADYAIITAENEDDLQRILHQFYTTALQYNMIISIEKIKTIVISKELNRYKLTMENKRIDQVMGVYYLGIKLSSHGKIEEEAKQQRTKANRICLNDFILVYR